MVRRSVAVAVVLAALAIPFPATAQEARKGEFAASFTWARQGNELIVYQPAGFLVEGTHFINEWLGITGELGYATASEEIIILDVSLNTLTTMGGVRMRYLNDSIVTPSFRVVGGLGHVTAKLGLLGLQGLSESANFFTLAIGGAVDFRVAENVAIRVQPDVLLFDASGPAMIRLAFGVSFGFGDRVTPPTPAPRRPMPRPDPVVADPVRAEPVAVEPEPAAPVARISAGALPSGPIAPQKVSETAGWTVLTGDGVGYEWNVTVRNGNPEAKIAVATVALHDANGNVLFTKVTEGQIIPAAGSFTFMDSGSMTMNIANRASYWTITVEWAGGDR